MSVSSVLGLRTVRIIAVPLTKPLGNSASAAQKGLTYYQYQLVAKEDDRVDRYLERTKIPRWIGTLSEKIRTTARGTWASFGKAPGGWKLKTYQFGERVVDRMDFEELSLRSVDPGIGPRPSESTRQSLKELASDKNDGERRVEIPLLYPSSVVSAETVLSELQAHVKHRTPLHKKRMYFWLAVAPFTAPFMIIPIIPNLPFIFCAWRAFTHWETYNASSYLERLLEKDCIVPESSEVLNALYKRHAPAFDTTPNHTLLLDREAVPEIVQEFELDKATTVDMNRALDQAKERIESGKLGGSR